MKFATFNIRTDKDQDGNKVGLIIETQYNGSYTVYFDDVMALMIAETQGMGMFEVVFVAERKYTYQSGIETDDGYIAGDMITDRSPATLSAQFIVDMSTGLLMQ